jgi:hypothetical protein
MGCTPSHSESASTRPESFTWEIPVKLYNHAAREIRRCRPISTFTICPAALLPRI